MGRRGEDYEEKVQQYKKSRTPTWRKYHVRRWDVMQPERLRNDSNVSKVQNYKKYEILVNEMGTWERTLSEGKIKFLHSVLKGYVLPQNETYCQN